jgi:hypothetical protein
MGERDGDRDDDLEILPLKNHIFLNFNLPA